MSLLILLHFVPLENQVIYTIIINFFFQKKKIFDKVIKILLKL